MSNATNQFCWISYEKSNLWQNSSIVIFAKGILQRVHLDLKQNWNQIKKKSINTRSGSRTSAISKMEPFLTAVNGLKALLTIFTKSSVLDVVRVIGLPPNTGAIAPFHKTLYGKLFELYINYLSYLHFSLQHLKFTYKRITWSMKCNKSRNFKIPQWK